jgi:low affinity Fe/Cu permease
MNNLLNVLDVRIVGDSQEWRANKLDKILRAAAADGDSRIYITIERDPKTVVKEQREWYDKIPPTNGVSPREGRSAKTECDKEKS